MMRILDECLMNSELKHRHADLLQERFVPGKEGVVPPVFESFQQGRGEIVLRTHICSRLEMNRWSPI